MGWGGGTSTARAPLGFVSVIWDMIMDAYLSIRSRNLNALARIFPLACVSIKRTLVQNSCTCLSRERHFSGFWKWHHWIRRRKLPQMVQKLEMAIFSRFITISVRTVSRVQQGSFKFWFYVGGQKWEIINEASTCSTVSTVQEGAFLAHWLDSTSLLRSTDSTQPGAVRDWTLLNLSLSNKVEWRNPWNKE